MIEGHPRLWAIRRGGPEGGRCRQTRSSMRLRDTGSRGGGDEIRWILGDQRLKRRAMAGNPDGQGCEVRWEIGRGLTSGTD